MATHPEDKFALGIDSMARNCQAAIKCVRTGKMTLDGVERWLEAVITNDPKYLAETLKEHFENPAPSAATVTQGANHKN